jgi:hypothetical protein
LIGMISSKLSIMRYLPIFNTTSKQMKGVSPLTTFCFFLLFQFAYVLVCPYQAYTNTTEIKEVAEMHDLFKESVIKQIIMTFLGTHSVSFFAQLNNSNLP